MYLRGKVIGGVLGMMIGGPIGALVGLFIGHKADKRRHRRHLAYRYSGHGEAIAAAVTALAAKLAKVDGHVSEAEIRTFRRIFLVPEHEVKRIAELWREAALTPAGYEPYARHLAQLFASRPDMLRSIFGGLQAVVTADGASGSGAMKPAQRWALEDVARIFELAPGWDRLKAPERFELGGAPVSADAMSEAFANMFDNRIADDDRQIFRQGQPWPRNLASLLGRPGVRNLLSACAFLSVYVMVRATGFADHLFANSEFVLSVGGGALAGWATHHLLSLPRGLPRQAEQAAAEAGVASSEVSSTMAETHARVERIRQGLSGLDAAVRARVEAICSIAEQIADGMLKDPSDAARSRPFLMHYLDATSDVVKRYADLQGREGAQAQFADVMAKMEPLLVDIEALFRQHYERGLKGEALGLDVSIDSLQRMVRSEGR